ncbi:hypothetical protein COHA_005660 [Chlorella ohadii]|uniref:Apple domain-containing protein n=1 Tax=Chlorella ohadii TaxID=2649997 RepID=A0AAD5DQK5_9CHLO|nr:hypothetical protein COHA_005660 [Chlorella ohadii]
MVAEAIAHGVDGLSNVVAGWAEAEGETEIAAAIRGGGDAFEATVMAALEATACAGHMKAGATIGGIAGCVLTFGLGCGAGAALGGVAGALISPACHRAVNEIATMVTSSWDTGTAVGEMLKDVQCSGRSFPAANPADCADECEDKVPETSCFTWYYDNSCCLCKIAPCESSSSSDSGGGSSSSSSSSFSQRPSSDGGGSCGSIEFDTDFFGGDIVPVTTKWADTAVAAASPEDCCEACSLYSYCGAWTFTPAENCKERFPGAPGCCFLKKGTGYEKRSATGMVSGTSGGPPVAACTLEFDTDLLGGDIQSGNGPDTVVPTISDADCCQSCAATPGCGAWTMAPPSDCASRLPNARGCCFLKHEGGWTRTKDEKGVLTSGQLI